jgi:hypothetical protein
MPTVDARKNYVEELLKVTIKPYKSSFFSRLYVPKILKSVEDESSKKYIAEIEAA